jgi:hypothetical protein
MGYGCNLVSDWGGFRAKGALAVTTLSRSFSP